ncbi:putative N,O-diacetyl muramidase [Echria macrotheca]|uniref:Lysozyme n=1 Tax=Echria macrotheca TaxID=438768 RepID=A0AAJ0FDH9_9PEZI|nr:putative N,O-diacetyl muramidase [Echria macrotheca]
MHHFLSVAILTAAITCTTAHPTNPTTTTRASSVQGFDISNWQPTFDFAAAYKSGGARFCMIKATEGTDFIDKSFSAHYINATDYGFVRGGYHFAHPSGSAADAQAQADFFLKHGGGWTADGITLPGMLDLEGSGSGDRCWDLSGGEMVAWIKAFSDRYHSKVNRYPMLYTSPSWWNECTGGSTAFAKTNALVLARWGSSPGTIPGGWAAQTIWQNSDSYRYGGDSDVFNGSEADLKKFATG